MYQSMEQMLGKLPGHEAGVESGYQGTRQVVGDAIRTGGQVLGKDTRV